MKKDLKWFLDKERSRSIKFFEIHFMLFFFLCNNFCTKIFITSDHALVLFYTGTFKVTKMQLTINDALSREDCLNDGILEIRKLQTLSPYKTEQNFFTAS